MMIMESTKTKLAERVSKAARLIFEHKIAAMSNIPETQQEIEEYLWRTLNRIGIDDTELGLQLIKTKFVTLKFFADMAERLKNVWAKIVWDIICHDDSKWTNSMTKNYG